MATAAFTLASCFSLIVLRVTFLIDSLKKTVEFLEPIEPGLDRKRFMATLKQRIEDRMLVLDAIFMNDQTEAI